MTSKPNGPNLSHEERKQRPLNLNLLVWVILWVDLPGYSCGQLISCVLPLLRVKAKKKCSTSWSSMWAVMQNDVAVRNTHPMRSVKQSLSETQPEHQLFSKSVRSAYLAFFSSPYVVTVSRKSFWKFHILYSCIKNCTRDCNSHASAFSNNWLQQRNTNIFS